MKRSIREFISSVLSLAVCVFVTFEIGQIGTLFRSIVPGTAMQETVSWNPVYFLAVPACLFALARCIYFGYKLLHSNEGF